MNSTGIQALLIVIATIIVSIIATYLTKRIIDGWEENGDRNSLTPDFACIMWVIIVFGTPITLANGNEIYKYLYRNIIQPTELANSSGTWIFLLFIAAGLSAYIYLGIDSMKKTLKNSTRFNNRKDL